MRWVSACGLSQEQLTGSGVRKREFGRMCSNLRQGSVGFCCPTPFGFEMWGGEQGGMGAGREEGAKEREGVG